MRFLVSIFTIFFTFAAQANQPVFELATLLGTANDNTTQVQRVVKEVVVLGDRMALSDMTTGLYDLIDRNGAYSSINYQVYLKNGATTKSILMEALEDAAKRAKIVFSIAGPIDNDICKLSFKYENTVFLFTAGTSAQYLAPFNHMFCLKSNMLIVGGLNRDATRMASKSNYGSEVVSLAVRSENSFKVSVDVGVEKVYSSTSFGAAIAAGLLAKTAREYPSLSGAALAEKFLEERAVAIPALEQYIRWGMALKGGSW